MIRPRGRNVLSRRLARPLVAFLVCIILAALLILDERGLLLVSRADDLAAYHSLEARVIRVIDGDTLEIDRPDAIAEKPTTRVRLWGIDCPEQARFDQPAEPFAPEASALATELCLQKTVRIWVEAHQTRDSFGRLLAHVELSDRSMLNEALLEAGLARADDRWAHARLVQYAQAELSAQRAKVGLWSQSAQ